MKKRKEFIIPWLIAALLLVSFAGIARVATVAGGTNVNKLTLDENEITDSDGTTRVTTGSTVTISGNLRIDGSSDLYMGTVSAVQSTATTSGLSQGRLETYYLSGTANAIEGSLLIATAPVAGQGVSVAVSLASNDQTGWIGVAAHTASTGNVVNVYTSGVVFAVSTGTVVAGDVLVSSAGARGYLGVDTTPTTGADVGVALSGGIAAGGRIRIRLR